MQSKLMLGHGTSSEWGLKVVYATHAVSAPAARLNVMDDLYTHPSVDE